MRTWPNPSSRSISATSAPCRPPPSVDVHTVQHGAKKCGVKVPPTSHLHLWHRNWSPLHPAPRATSARPRPKPSPASTKKRPGSPGWSAPSGWLSSSLMGLIENEWKSTRCGTVHAFSHYGSRTPFTPLWPRRPSKFTTTSIHSLK